MTDRDPGDPETLQEGSRHSAGVFPQCVDDTLSLNVPYITMIKV